MSAHNSRHGTTCSISSRNTCRRVFFVYCSKPFIVARLLCCLFVDFIWRNLLYIPVERETLFRVSLGQTKEEPYENSQSQTQVLLKKAFFRRAADFARRGPGC